LINSLGVFNSAFFAITTSRLFQTGKEGTFGALGFFPEVISCFLYNYPL
jgi:hypothetical protein